jgi:predicted alpha-1,2-mannosidase
VDGKYRGIDHNIHQNEEGHTNYTIFSLWDTYRAEHPLLNIIDPVSAADMIESMVSHAHQSVHGILPVWSHAGNENWCMIGYHGVSAVADAFLYNDKVHSNLDYAVFPHILYSANLDYYDHTDLYKKLGYVPYDKSAVGTSITLENAYEDWVIYRLLDSKIRVDSEDKEIYRQRALNFKNVFNPETGFAQARYEDGSWKTPADLLSTSNEGFIEGNSWNYSFYVPHDVNGLIKIMGGDKVFVNRLDELFTMYVPDKFFAETEDVTREGMLGGYVHGNEPSHHVPYLYALAGKPEKTEARVKRIMETMYSNAPDGLCGNDDCGQMSAWYILSAVGEYPVCPGAPLGTVTCVPKTIIVNPVFEMESDVVKDKMEVGIGNIDTGCVAWYRIGGTGEFKRYSKPFTIHGACRLECYSQHRDGRKSFVTVCNVSKAD